MSKVKVTAKNGQVVVPSENKPEYGYIRVESVMPMFDETTGFMRNEVRSALVKGTVKDLQSLNWTEGQELEGKIAILETTEPRYDGQEPKRAGSDKDAEGNPTAEILVDSQGRKIYRDGVYTLNTDKADVLIDHVNKQTAAAKAAKAAANATAGAQIN